MDLVVRQSGASVQAASSTATKAGLGCCATLHSSIEAIPQEVWDGMLPGDPESYEFYRAVEPAPPPGFRLGAISVRQGDRILAVAPTFEVDYRLDTPLQGGLRRITNWIHGRVPGLMSLSVIGIGSPMSDNCTVGFLRSLDPGERASMFATMLDRLKQEARARRISLLAVKGLGRFACEFAQTLGEHGYLRATTVPLAMLPMKFTTFDAWLDSLPKKERIYFRKKLKSAADVRIEYRTSIKGLESQIVALLDATLAQSKVDYGDFDKVHAGYFSNVVDRVGKGMQMMLCWKGDELISFQLSLIGRDRIINNKLGMKYPEARECNLFFLNWLMLVRYAIENGVSVIEMGATTYATKLLFGGYLERRWLYFRCRWGLATAVMRPFLRYADFERNDPELMKLNAIVHEQGETIRL
jgi:Acetyltransferase (GNAT) domain